MPAPKRCFTNGFVMFCNVIKWHQVSVENLMLFDAFGSQNAKMAPKASINDKVYKVFRMTFSKAPKRCVANVFLMFCYVVKGCQIIVKNLVLF